MLFLFRERQIRSSLTSDCARECAETQTRAEEGKRRGKIRISVAKQNCISVRRVMVCYWYRFRGHTTGILPYDNKVRLLVDIANEATRVSFLPFMILSCTGLGKTTTSGLSRSRTVLTALHTSLTAFHAEMCLIFGMFILPQQ